MRREEVGEDTDAVAVGLLRDLVDVVRALGLFHVDARGLVVVVDAVSVVAVVGVSVVVVVVDVGCCSDVGGTGAGSRGNTAVSCKGARECGDGGAEVWSTSICCVC